MDEADPHSETNVDSETVNASIDQAMTAHTLTQQAFGFLPKSKAAKIRKNLSNIKAKKRSIEKRVKTFDITRSKDRIKLGY